MLMKSSTQSLTEQLSERFAERIRNRLLAPGARLPSVRQCAQQNGVSPSTVVAAYDQLLALGLVEARKNRGFFVRDSGGTAVPHGAGILNMSILLPRTTTDLGHYYHLLGAPLLALLGEYGLTGNYDFVPGSFCDGQYNLVIGGRKVTGTAQRWLAPGQDHQGAVLAQAMLLVAGDVDEGTRMASRFYELAGGELRFMTGTSTTLASCIDWRGGNEALVDKVRARLDRLLSEGLSPSP